MKTSRDHPTDRTFLTNTSPSGNLDVGDSLAHARTGSADGRFRLAFDKAPIGLAIVGLDYRIQRVNKSLCDALEFSAEELCGRLFTDLSHPDDKRKDLELASKLARSEIESYRREKRYLTKSGCLVWLDVTSLPIRDDDGKIIYGLAMMENITERRTAQEALRTSEERYRSFVANSSEGIWRFEVEEPIDITLPIEEQIALFYKYGYLAECNDALARMYGHERADDMVGARFGEVSLATNPANVPLLRNFLESGYRLRNAETSKIDDQGVRKYFSNSVIGIVIRDRLLRVWGTQRDVTEEKVSDQEVKTSRLQLRSLAARLQSIRESESIKIAREMHDVLGQLLTSVKLDLSWLRKRAPTFANESSVSGIEERLDSAILHVDKTIAAVKHLSTELRPVVLDKFGLEAAVEWQCNDFEKRTGLKCSCHVPEGKLDISDECATALFRILQESLVNVVRHSGAQRVDVDLQPCDTILALTVRDNGKGISAAEVQSLSSLGLLGMRERAELLGGTFAIRTQENGGTILTAKLPLADCGEASKNPK